jgi:F0F1-type ATP synthase assembly protein I
MNGPGEENKKAFRSAVTITVVGVAVITLVTLFAALFLGIWIDKVLGTKPLFTIGLVIVGIPVTIGLTFWLVRKATGRLKLTQANPSTKETDRGTDYNS